ncbi:Outer membrane protein beta-barrel domain-containing protein [Formosa sp. Hel1_31_208]|uniref:outer membrane beta-barrel protein n=1 Tax=Formosa sp. Hel1_31_208 TaxID=1798225 RepID=UPI00087B7F17|nr:outer membrane beta-barrel protein [Formosa sp. Hel1_31_208]SDR85830.1 Outer membrane protein beta-barrel domain-containing protein [Formosa sp. Hel1_31_208]
MTSNYRLQILPIIVLVLCCISTTYAQRDTNKWKAQIAIGVNSPSQSGFVDGFVGKSINFPTVNLGIQHMFKPELGAKFDFGFNRFSSDDASLVDFKTNYTRINIQMVYDPTERLGFMPRRMGLVAHVGPGYSFVKPLGDFGANDNSFLNVMAGLEFHYGLTQQISVYSDLSYILGLSGDFEPETDGFGSFNGNLLTITFGITFSISGCQYCD